MKNAYLIFVCLLSVLCLAQVKRTTVAVMSFKGSSGVTQDESDLLTDRLRVDLFNTGIVDVMEREQMQAILKEQGFQKSGACTDEGCMVEMGEILGVQKLITGSIGKLGSLYLLNARIIDIKTAKITRSVSEDVKGSLEDVAKRLPEVATRLCSAQGPEIAPPKQKKIDDAGAAPPDQPPGPLDCSNKVFIEKVEFPRSSLGFAMTGSEWLTAYGKLVDGLKKCFSAELCVASSEQLSQAAGCAAVILRPRLNSYTTRPTKFGQKEGTLNLSLAVYESPAAKDPLCVFSKEATGENHWGDGIPFANAIGAVADKMKKDLDKSDCIAAINRKKK